MIPEAIIRNATRQHESQVEMMWADMIFELSMRLGWEEERVIEWIDENGI